MKLYSISGVGVIGSKDFVISFNGTGFDTAIIPTITIGDAVCIESKCTSVISCSAKLPTLLTPNTGNFDVEIIQGGNSVTSMGLFKYPIPTVSNITKNGSNIIVTLENRPLDDNLYYLQLETKLYLRNEAMEKSVGKEIYFNFSGLDNSGGNFTFTLYKSTENGPEYYPAFGIYIQPTIIDISLNHFDMLNPVNVTINGTFFGNEASVVIGKSYIPVKVSYIANGTASVTFKSPTEFEYPLTISILTDQYDLIFVSNFTFEPVNINSITQLNNSLKIQTNNTGTNIDKIKINFGSTNETESKVNSFINQTIIANIPNSVGNGEIQFNLNINNQTFKESITIKPIISTISTVSYLSGNVTITGYYLNNTNVSIIFKNNTENYINCNYNENENVSFLVCATPPGQGTITFKVSNVNSTIMSSYDVPPIDDDASTASHSNYLFSIIIFSIFISFSITSFI